MDSTTDENVCVDGAHVERIAKLNDDLRTKRTGGQFLISRGVQALTGVDASNLLAVLAAFNSFGPDNDPYGEHDFGSFELCGAKLMWKIDYYGDSELRFGSNDPANPEMTWRVLTVFLASEY